MMVYENLGGMWYWMLVTSIIRILCMAGYLFSHVNSLVIFSFSGAHFYTISMWMVVSSDFVVLWHLRFRMFDC